MAEWAKPPVQSFRPAGIPGLNPTLGRLTFIQNVLNDICSHNSSHDKSNVL